MYMDFRPTYRITDARCSKTNIGITITVIKILTSARFGYFGT